MNAEKWLYARITRGEWDRFMRGHDDIEWFSDEAMTVFATSDEWEAAHPDIHSDEGEMAEPSEFPAVVRRRVG